MIINDFNEFKINIHQLFPKLEELKEKLIKDKFLIIICGPTGTGKSDLAFYMAKLFATNIISIDSMQAYRKMNIGTDKKNYEENGVIQYMVDICEPDHILTSAEYRNIARKIIEEKFFKKSMLPILAGGSGLHIRAVTEDLMHAPGGDFKFRNKFKEDSDANGIESLYEKLKKLDNKYAEKISINDERRILRALEVIETSGKKYSDFQDKWVKRKSIYNCVFLGLNIDRKKLYESVEKRIDIMIKNGLLKEVDGLFKEGFGDSLSFKQAIGYKELSQYLKEEISFEEAVKNIKTNTRHLVKKQLTWFKADERIEWIMVDNYDNIYNLILSILNVIAGQVFYEKN